MDDMSPLEIAMQNRYYECMECLLEHGADVNNKDKDGWTPLLHAICRQPRDVIIFLLNHGADPNIKNNKGRTAKDFVPTWNPSVIDLFDDFNDFIKEPGEL